MVEVLHEERILKCRLVRVGVRVGVGVRAGRARVRVRVGVRHP